MLSRIVWFCEQGRQYRSPLLASGLVSLVTVLVGSVFDFSYKGTNPLSDSTVLIAFLISVLFLTWWSFSTDRAYRKIGEMMIKSRFRNPKIGILSSIKLNDEEIKDLLRSTSYTPEMWLENLGSKKLGAERTNCVNLGDCFAITVNPFGELYLEDDIMNMTTFRKIKEYIRRGGVFVSTAGLAFYYMYNPKTKTEGLTGPFLETYSGTAMTEPAGPKAFKSSIALQPAIIPDNSSLVDTWLYRSFGIRTTLGDARALKARAVGPFDNIIEGELDIKEFRSALRCENSDCRLIPVIRSDYAYQPTGRKHECYPIAAVKYGFGYLILVGMALNDEKHLSLVRKTTMRVIELLKMRGFLEQRESTNE